MKSVYICIALILVAFATGWTANSWQDDSVKLAIEQATTKSREASTKAAAEAIAKIEVKNTTINAKVIERIKTETVYAECRHSPDTYQLILEAFK